MCLIRKSAPKPYINCGIPLNNWHWLISKRTSCGWQREKQITQIYDFNEFEEVVFDAQILIRSLCAMVFHVRVASGAENVIICAAFQFPIEMWPTPLVVLNVFVLTNCVRTSIIMIRKIENSHNSNLPEWNTKSTVVHCIASDIGWAQPILLVASLCRKKIFTAKWMRPKKNKPKICIAHITSKLSFVTIRIDMWFGLNVIDVEDGKEMHNDWPINTMNSAKWFR